jgi:hypothetical protein
MSAVFERSEKTASARSDVKRTECVGRNQNRQLMRGGHA